MGVRGRKLKETAANLSGLGGGEQAMHDELFKGVFEHSVHGSKPATMAASLGLHTGFMQPPSARLSLFHVRWLHLAHT
jgi:hypothetical protein